MIDKSFTWTDVDTTGVTDEEIARCHPLPDGSGFLVASRSQTGSQHEVKWEDGPSCTCLAGQHGFVHCRDGICAHVRWCAAFMQRKAHYS